MVDIGAKLKREDIVFSSSSVTAGIVLAEPFVLVRGFKRNEQADAPPAILRGSLVLQIHKPTKIKSINLDFKGICRTEWPEGIPPLKIDTHETKTVFYHGWPFFNSTHDLPEALGMNPMIHVEGRGRSESQSSGSSNGRRGRSRTLEVKDIFQAVSTIRSASPQIRSRSRGSSMSDKSYRLFAPAEYVYNFELAIPSVLPESTRCNFGSVRYHLEASIERQGTFKSNLQGIRDVQIIRGLALTSIEYSEPIVIDRSWEDILRYEIIVAGKVFAIGSPIPVGISLLPLDKAGCHRIRIFITEHCEYYCKNRKVHRVEPTRRFLLLERKPKEGTQGSLLHELHGDQVEGSTQLDLQAPILKQFPGRRDILRPNITSNSIKVHHWIKISMRLSRPHPTTPGGRKTYEISIDSPIMLVDPRVTKTAMLPAYAQEPTNEMIAAENNSIAFQAHNLLSEGNTATAFFSQPENAPPSIDAETAPPNIFPPAYAHDESMQSYQNRYREFVTDDEHIQGDHISAIYWEEEDSDGHHHPNIVVHRSDDEDDHEHSHVHDGHNHGPGHVVSRDLSCAATLDVAPSNNFLSDDDSTDQHSSSTALTSSSADSQSQDAQEAQLDLSTLDFPPLRHVNSGIDPLSESPLITTAPASSSSECTTPSTLGSSSKLASINPTFAEAALPPRSTPFSGPSSSSSSRNNYVRDEVPRPFTQGSSSEQRRSVTDAFRPQSFGSRHSSVDRPPLDRRRGSSSSSVRFFRQTSLVSVDLIDQSSARYRSRGGGQAEPVMPWYMRPELDDDQVSVTINECDMNAIGGTDRVPLLDDDQSEHDLVDFDDDVVSLGSRCPSIVRP